MYKNDLGFTKYGHEITATGTLLEGNVVQVEEYLTDTRENKSEDIDEFLAVDISNPKKKAGDKVEVTIMYSESVPGRSFAVEVE